MSFKNSLDIQSGPVIVDCLLVTDGFSFTTDMYCTVNVPSEVYEHIYSAIKQKLTS